MKTIAALYVDPKGPYYNMPGVDCWDEKRDARLYDGPWPVVAHPPCGPWGALWKLCTKQPVDCGPIAVKQVQTFGGVLEHPAFSKLWKHCGIPVPGAEGVGYTIQCDQVHFGHAARKRTWLYIVGVPREEAWMILNTFADYTKFATHVIKSGSTVAGMKRKTRLPELRKSQRHITPPNFAEMLVALARAVRR